MPKEWYQVCKDCGKRFGYSNMAHHSMKRKGHSRPERCPEHRDLHAREIVNLASSHFSLVPRTGPPSILGTPNLGQVDHADRSLQEMKIEPNSEGMDIGFNENHMAEIYDALSNHQVLVIVGPTGSGKSTFVPYCLINPIEPYEKDHFTQNGPIIVTQPRIKATRGVSNAIAEKLLGSSIGPGFEIGFRHGDGSGKRRGENYDSWNRLIFVTDGTLINWLTEGKLADYSMIMIDEAHERSCNIDLILSLLKRELLKYPHVKLIIASATIDAEAFRDFFEETTTVWLRDFADTKKTWGYDLHFWDNSPIAETPSDANKKMPFVVAQKVLDLLRTTETGGILAFLPGKDEIRKSIRFILKKLQNDRTVKVFELHASLPPDESDAVTDELPEIDVRGRKIVPRRVVIATNVAETSITVPDVEYVVDSGLIKQQEWNIASFRKELKVRWHSQDGCKQRWGRAGRNRKGDVYALYTKDQYHNFEEHTSPEITRNCLEDVFLAAKAAGVNDVSPTNFSWIQEPPEDELNRTLSVFRARRVVDHENDFTEEGLELYQLSKAISRSLDKYDYNSTQRALDVASLLIFADTYGCLVEAVTSVVMMPRMGNALCWKEDGLLVWDLKWDLESKDRISRIFNSLQVGCDDDLEFSLKLFALYEQGKHDPAFSDWNERHFINVRNFELLERARMDLVEPFLQDKRDLLKSDGRLRPINFELLPRLRILMALAWPDRIAEIESGNPSIFMISSGNNEVRGLISAHSCGCWDAHKTAIVGILDTERSFFQGEFQYHAIANFLISMPESVPDKTYFSLIDQFSKLRKDFDKNNELTQLIADQFAPVGGIVELQSNEGYTEVVSVINRPKPFSPSFEELFEEYEIELEDELRYHDGISDLDENSNWMAESADPLGSFSDESESVREVGPKVKLSFDVSSFDIPPFPAVLRTQNFEDTASILVWARERSQWYAVVTNGDQASVRARYSETVKVGSEIEVEIEQEIYDFHPIRITGYIGCIDNELRFPIPITSLSIASQNSGLKSLVGQKIQLLLTGFDPKYRFPVVTLLPVIEQDLAEIVELEEIEGELVEIFSKYDEDWCEVGIYRPNGICHNSLIKYEHLLEFLGNPSPGDKVVLEAHYLESDEPWRTRISPEIPLTKINQELLSQCGLAISNDTLQCHNRMTYLELIKVCEQFPELAHSLRKLYELSQRLRLVILYTHESRGTYKQHYEAIQSIYQNASLLHPGETRSKIMNYQSKIKEDENLSRAAQYKLRGILKEAWSITDKIVQRLYAERITEAQEIRDNADQASPRITRQGISSFSAKIREDKIWDSEQWANLNSILDSAREILERFIERKSKKVARGLEKDIRSVITLASTLEPRESRGRILDMRDLVNREEYLTNADKSILRGLIQQAWEARSIQIRRKEDDFIQRQYANIEKLEGYIAQSSDALKIARWQRFIIENKQKIDDVLQQRRERESKRGR